MTDFGAAADLRSGALQALLPSWALPGGGIHMVYPATRQPPGKVRHFIDFCRDYLQRSA